MLSQYHITGSNIVLRVIVEFFVEENQALEDDFTDFYSRPYEVDIACKTIFCRYEID